MDYQYLHITPSDLSPEVTDLNARIALECLDPEYTHPHWVDASWETDIAPLVEIKSYADYLSRKAYSGIPLSPSEDKLLQRAISRAEDKPAKSKKKEWEIRLKRREMKRLEKARIRSDPRLFYAHLGEICRRLGTELLWTREGLEDLFNNSVIIPFRIVPDCTRLKGGWDEKVGMPPTWIGSIREALTPVSLGGMGLTLSFARRDPSKGLGPGNTDVHEGFRNGTTPGRVLLQA